MTLNKTYKFVVSLLSFLALMVTSFSFATSPVSAQAFGITNPYGANRANNFGQNYGIAATQNVNTTNTAPVNQNATSVTDGASQYISWYLRQRGWNSGFIYTEDLNSVGIPWPVNFIEGVSDQDILNAVPADQRVAPVSLDSLIARPQFLEDQNVYPQTYAPKQNLIVYPALGIEAPIQYGTFDDFFLRDAGGNIDTNAMLSSSDLNSPSQIKLQSGVLHLPVTAQPGRQGCAYIVGHSSNYASVVSNYNYIFADLQGTYQPGQEFFIYDQYGRRLKFVTYEGLAVATEDSATAFACDPNSRTVTLQASILTQGANGFLYPTHRWLTRGQLVLE